MPEAIAEIQRVKQASQRAVPITVAPGDGIGPAIMQASLEVLEAAGAQLSINTIDIGESVYRAGHSAGISDAAWESLRETGVFFKAPITTPQGGGYKSLNVTIRKSLGLFANIRPCSALAPFIPTRHPEMDLVVIRENEEDLYAGIEHRQTDEVYQCLKLISRPGCEKIIRYAFEYARANGRRKVSCFTKDNIMKMTDGLFHRVFDEVAADYPGIATDHWIIDIAAARLADTPEMFDVVVMPNLYGDILSDIAAQISGSVGLAPSANIGVHGAMFEAIHGSAPPLAGRDIANPSGLLRAGVMMLLHLGQTEAAERIQNAWLKTIEDGIHTADVYRDGVSTRRVGTKAFADAVIERIGERPERLAEAHYATASAPIIPVQPTAPAPAKKTLVGVDVFIHSRQTPQALADSLQCCQAGEMALEMITNRGVKVWPNGMPETFCTDHWRCRFMAASGETMSKRALIDLLDRLADAGIDFVKTEQLYAFDGERGYSLGQGQ
ncbi:NADP-dependent isocitrate dehydrogenase [Spiribacter onubensis]|uniref:Isocitrate dehydrogenase [NADP] n=1 Tax=Spiribacter onubensis TaxID=3122420 RepID=A0ABV3S7U1_9GAMM